MRSTRSLVSLSILMAGLVGMVAINPAPADEGMWLPYRLADAPYTKWLEKGLQLDENDLWNPNGPDISDAIVHLGGGTGSFVSEDGLIVTNHHVAFGALQRQSTVEVNVMEDGFLARERSEEIPAPGYDAYVLESVKDVTDQVLDKAKKKDGRDRYLAIDRAQKELVKKAEEGRDVRADVDSFFGGSKYYLFTYLKIKDVRIVYAPPATIGIYGGEIDNWMWPRHTGDFSFLRAYVAPNGESAEYSEENVPYHPRKFLTFSIAPLDEGDFTMVMGYPGRTMRTRTSYAIDYYIGAYYPNRIQQYGDLIALLDARAAEDPAAAIKVASLSRGLANSYKNSQGQLEGLLAHDLLHHKQAEEAAINDYLEAHPKDKRRYGTVIPEMAELWKHHSVNAEQETALKRLSYFATGPRSAYVIAKWAQESEKKDIERDQGYQERDRESHMKRLEYADRGYDEMADKAVFGYYIKWLAPTLKHHNLPSIAKIVGDHTGDDLDAAVNAFLDDVYANTQVTDHDTRMEMFGLSKKELAKRNDMLIDFAMSLVADLEKIKEQDEAFRGSMTKLRPEFIKMREFVRDVQPYSDANSTMRLSVGEIEGYSPRDGVWMKPFTTMAGMIAKNTEQDPFICPEKLIALHAARDFGPYADPALGDVPVCFLSNDDITGGNSGSPILNGRGEIIGLVFDGNYESISADYQFLPDLTRAIHVDSRYVLFVTDKFSNASELMSELTITGATEGAMR